MRVIGVFPGRWPHGTWEFDVRTDGVSGRAHEASGESGYLWPMMPPGGEHGTWGVNSATIVSLNGSPKAPREAFQQRHTTTEYVLPCVELWFWYAIMIYITICDGLSAGCEDNIP